MKFLTTLAQIATKYSYLNPILKLWQRNKKKHYTWNSRHYQNRKSKNTDKKQKDYKKYVKKNSNNS